MKTKILLSLIAAITLPLHADATSDAKTFLDAQAVNNYSPTIATVANANVAAITAAVPVAASLSVGEDFTLSQMLWSMTTPPTAPGTFDQSYCPANWLGRTATEAQVVTWVAANPNTYMATIVYRLMYISPSSGSVTTALTTYEVGFIGKPADFVLWPHWFLKYLQGQTKAQALTYLTSEAAYLATLPASSDPSTPPGKFAASVATAQVLYNNMP